MSAPRRVFRAFTSLKNEAYTIWLEKVEKKKGQFLMDQEIYDLIQVSRYCLKFNMIIVVSFSRKVLLIISPYVAEW